MDQRGLLILGAGGHGLVVAETAVAAGWTVLQFVDDAAKPGATLNCWNVVNRLPDPAPGVNVIVAVGDNAARASLLARAAAAGHTLASVIHPTAWVSPSATVGRGVYIGPRAVVNAAAKLGDGVIINSGAIVEHHCQIAPCAHVAPGAALAGHVIVGEWAMVGIGAAIRPRVTIGVRATIGAGAAVVSNVPPDSTWVGAPAKPIHR